MLWKSLAFVLLTIVCWGIYGPVLHRGQEAMNDGKWRPFLCVGMAYFAIAVVVPIVLMQTGVEPKATHGFSFSGIVWSSAGGVAGALGALGIILAFNFGGKPSWVMPLVFGCAPVVNAFLTIYWKGTWGQVSPMFLAGLILVAMGAVMVMLFKPGPPKPHAAPTVAMAGVEAAASTSPPPAGAPPADSPGSASVESTAQDKGDASAAEDAKTSASEDAGGSGSPDSASPDSDSGNSDSEPPAAG
jgi:hypothetical protein